MPAEDFDKSREFDVITPIHVAFFSVPTPLMKAVEKAKVIRIVRAELEAQYRRVAAAAREAHGYATDPDSKAESKYDTRSLEASYLAVGQSEKADELAAAIRSFQPEAFPPFSEDQAADLGAVVHARYPDRASALFVLATLGGGISCELDGDTIMVVTPSAPVFQALQGRRAGDRVAEPEFEVVSVL